MRHFASIGTDFICNGIQNSERDVIADNVFETTPQVTAGTLLEDFMYRKYQNNVWSTDKFNPSLSFTQDKQQITADGLDTCTIIVHVTNTATDTISFTVNGTTQAIVTDGSGNATFRLVSQVPGDFTISMVSAFYGSATTTVKGV